MKTNQQNILDEFYKLSEEAALLKAKIDETQLKIKYPDRPIRPVKPRKPEIWRNKKPVFLKGDIYLYILFIFCLPLFLIILFFFNPENMSIVFGICIALPLIPLYLIYNNEGIIYNKQEKRNTEMIKLFNNQTQSYNEQSIIYDRNILNYNNEVKRLHALDNVKILVAERNQIVEKIKPMIKEIDRFKKDLSATDNFNFWITANIYELSRNNSFLERPSYMLEECYEKYGENVNKENLNKAEDYLKNISSKKLDYILNLLKQVEEVQKSSLSITEKTAEIKYILWSQHSATKKLWIGGVIGTFFGLLIFGTGGIGIAGLGSAFGISGFLAGTTGGILISSLIQNFENKNKQ